MISLYVKISSCPVEEQQWSLEQTNQAADNAVSYSVRSRSSENVVNNNTL